MDVIELLGALHHQLQADAGPVAPGDLTGAFAIIRRAVEADPATDRYDRETLDVIDAKLAALIAEIEAGVAEPDFKPSRTWVAALGAALYRRQEAAKKAAEEAARKVVPGTAH